MNSNQYEFVKVDANEQVRTMTQEFEEIFGATVMPASPDNLFLRWAANIFTQLNAMINYAGNQNLPSRAHGASLDVLSELFYQIQRPQPKPSICTARFTISGIQSTAILVPAGTGITGSGLNLIWETTADTYIQAGQTTIDFPVVCKTPGALGNGFLAGQLNTIVNPFPYFKSCTNTTTTAGGANISSDNEFRELMRESKDAISTAGGKGGYKYFAKQVSNEIADVVANNKVEGTANIYVLMKTGEPAGEEIKKAVIAMCSDEFKRPLTDKVVVEDAVPITYNIDLTYYIPSSSQKSAAEIESEVARAIETYVDWQKMKLGRDINPSYLHSLLMGTGIKRVEIRSPAFQVLKDGSDNTAPQFAKLGTRRVTNGGYENE